MNKVIILLRESHTARFFIPVGIITLVFGIFMLIANSGNQDYIKAEAIVSKTELVQEAYTDAEGNVVDAVYKVYVKYTVDNNEYEVVLGELSGYKEGQKTTIYYNPSDPNQITQIKGVIVPIIIIGAGIASLTGGIISGAKTIKKYNKMKEQEKEWANE